MAHQFTPIAIMLDRYTNMPYQMWEMKPQAVNDTLFTISGAIIALSIHIKVGLVSNILGHLYVFTLHVQGHLCCLASAAKDDDTQLLLHLVGKWTTFHALQEVFNLFFFIHNHGFYVCGRPSYQLV